MCIPHGASMPTSSGYAKEEKPKKHIEKVSQEQFEKGDPNFVDERNTEDESKNKKKSFFEFLFS
jgi:hypothetical protein